MSPPVILEGAQPPSPDGQSRDTLPRPLNRNLVCDAAFIGILVLAVGVVHRIDVARGPTSITAEPPAQPVVVPSETVVQVDPTDEQAASTADAPQRDEESPQTPTPDVAEISVKPETPRKPAGIIADFVPFTQLIEVELAPQRDHVAPRKVEFFDAEAMAAAVGFVVDCSGSMAGEKFEAVRGELARSITQLEADQRFFVVFFNQGFFPMTGSSAHPSLVVADHANKKQVLSFLKSATSDGGTDPEPALQYMARLQPDMIYLLTDGEFNPLQEATYSQLSNSKIAVHTIGFETGYTVPVLQDIARRTGGTYRSAQMGNAASSLFFASEGDVLSALSSADSAIRREAMSVAIVRELPLVKDMIKMLRDADSTVRQSIHDELRVLAGGTDFGPHGADDIDQAIARWSRWWELRNASVEQLLDGLRADDLEERWVVASRVRTGRVNVADEIIDAMRTSPSPIWQEFRASLRQIFPGQDFGPADDADSDLVAAAADRWAEWQVHEKKRIAAELLAKRIAMASARLNESRSRVDSDLAEARVICLKVIDEFSDTPSAGEAKKLLEEIDEKIAEELLAKRIKLAKEKLRLARMLIKVNPTAVERRCRELIRDFADTPSAADAKVLLEEVGGTLEED